MKHRLALIKALSWRVSGIILMGAMMYVSTGRVDVTALNVSIYAVIRTVQYYWNEYLWQVWMKRHRDNRIIAWIWR